MRPAMFLYLCAKFMAAKEIGVVSLEQVFEDENTFTKTVVTLKNGKKLHFIDIDYNTVEECLEYKGI